MENMENMENNEEINISEKVTKEVEKCISRLIENGLEKEDVELLGDLVDIHKDIENEKYWKNKEEDTMYYNRYNDGTYSRDFSGAYGRQGMKGTGPYSRYNGGRGSGRYRGEDMLNTAYEAYRDYNRDMEYGNYGTNESMQKIEIMADSLMDFVEHIMETAKTPEEKELIQRKIQELGRM